MPAGDERGPGRGPAIQPGSYLVVTNWRRHLHYSDRRAKWIKTYVAGDDDGRRGLDDEALTALPDTARLLFELFLRLAARMDNLVPYDSRRIGGWVSMRPQDVGRAIPLLVDGGYLEVVANVKLDAAGGLQLPLAASAQPLENASTTASQPSDNVSTIVSQSLENALTPNGASAQPGPTAADPASDTVRLTRAGARAAEQDRDVELPPSNTTVVRDAAEDLALPDDSQTEDRAIVGRIVALACRGDTRSAAIVRREAQGMPESVLATALESLLGRRPRPANPGGYVVNAIRSIAADQGIERERATIEREPDL